MSIAKFARKLYPMNLNRWNITVGVSLFVSLFMIFFQPFGLQSLDSEYKTLLLAGYGMVTFLVLFIDMIIIPLILPGIFKEEDWTIFREFTFLIWILLTISLGNYAYSLIFSIVFWHGINGFVFFILFTTAIGLFPIIGIITIRHNMRLKKYLEASRKMNQRIDAQSDKQPMSTNVVEITSESKNQVIQTAASNLICLESEGNYVNTWYLEEGKIIRLLIRNTIRNVELQTGELDNLFKCHRAYIINLSHIERVRGNSQGYRVSMKYLDKDIPVARNYSKAFREAINKRT